MGARCQPEWEPLAAERFEEEPSKPCYAGERFQVQLLL